MDLWSSNLCYSRKDWQHILMKWWVSLVGCNVTKWFVYKQLSHSSGDWKVQDQDPGRMSDEAPSWSTDGHLFAMSFHDGRAGELSGASFMRTCLWVCFMSSVCEDCPCDLITSQRSHFQIPALWGLGFIVNWGGRGRGTQTFCLLTSGWASIRIT